MQPYNPFEPPRRRRVWPFVLLAVVLAAPTLAFVAFSALKFGSGFVEGFSRGLQQGKK